MTYPLASPHTTRNVIVSRHEVTNYDTSLTLIILCHKNTTFMVRDDLKLPDDIGKVPKLNGVVDGAIPTCAIVFLLDGKLTR